uniref:Uncharacterized protein n=1 Tax=uncultured marine virus TaxID=186617 RepID=S4TDM0_9VIRU|nr:hypothetical protein [uncultured marine virus]
MVKFKKRVPQKSKRFEKSVKKIVLDELKQEIEEKHAICEYNNKNIAKGIPSGPVLNADQALSTGNFYKILPQIEQSTAGAAGRAYNTRIGNEICLKEIDLHGYLSHADDATSSGSLPNARLAVRVMILKAKEINDGQILFQNMPTNNLLRFGNWAATGPDGTANFAGYSLDPFRDINRDAFAVRYDKVFTVNAPVIVVGTSNPNVGVIPSTTKRFRHKLKFGERGLKLKYTNTTDLEPNNFPYFLCVGYASTTGSSGPEDDKVRMTLSCVGTYTDA